MFNDDVRSLIVNNAISNYIFRWLNRTQHDDMIQVVIALVRVDWRNAHRCWALRSFDWYFTVDLKNIFTLAQRQEGSWWNRWHFSSPDLAFNPHARRQQERQTSPTSDRAAGNCFSFFHSVTICISCLFNNEQHLTVEWEQITQWEMGEKLTCRTPSTERYRYDVLLSSVIFSTLGSEKLNSFLARFTSIKHIFIFFSRLSSIAVLCVGVNFISLSVRGSLSFSRWRKPPRALVRRYRQRTERESPNSQLSFSSSTRNFLFSASFSSSFICWPFTHHTIRVVDSLL